MGIKDDINLILRDHEGYTGDGRGGVGDLPIGDRSTARKPISKRDLREVLGAVHDSVADPADAAMQAAEDAIDAAERAELAASGVEYPVSYAPQTLTAPQQAQARDNIGAVAIADLPELEWATEAEALAGIATDKVMSPAGVRAAIEAHAPQSVVFTVSGEWELPPGTSPTRMVRIEAVGAGGGGGTSGSTGQQGGGGGGGGYASQEILAGDIPPGPFPVIVGAPGLGAVGSGQATDGGASSALGVTASGGLRGQRGPGGDGGGVGGGTGGGGAAAALPTGGGGGGDLNGYAGGMGGLGGGGGGGGNINLHAGGASVGAGAGGDGGYGALTPGGAGQNGFAPGGGGGGSRGAAAKGGDGARGEVRISLL